MILNTKIPPSIGTRPGGGVKSSTKPVCIENGYTQKQQDVFIFKNGIHYGFINLKETSIQKYKNELRLY